jgi:hypothetical protein
MTIDASKMAAQAKRTAKAGPDITVATAEDVQQLLDIIDELSYRVLQLEVRHNDDVVTEINHLNEWLNDFRGRHEVLCMLPWYRWYMWLSPHMGLPHFPKRRKIRGIHIRDTKPVLRMRNDRK